MAGPMSEVTQILNAVNAGDRAASEELLPLVYEELRRLAAHQMRLEQPGHTLQATALVHEAYLRLVGSDASTDIHWDGRGHFFAAAAEAMRRILVEAARRRGAVKRGGRVDRVELNEQTQGVCLNDEEILAVHDVVDKLALVDPTAARLVKLRFFAGCTTSDAALALGLPVRTAHEVWVYARAWLRHQLRQE
jgi:RNA polymerase sigma factor (TIGR02999 family)